MRLKKVIFPICAITLLSACSAMEGMKADLFDAHDAMRDTNTPQDTRDNLGLPKGYSGQRKGAVLKPPGYKPPAATVATAAAEPLEEVDTDASRKLIANTQSGVVSTPDETVQAGDDVLALDPSWPAKNEDVAPQVISSLQNLPLASNRYQSGAGFEQPSVPETKVEQVAQKPAMQSMDKTGSVEAEMYMYADQARRGTQMDLAEKMTNVRTPQKPVPLTVPDTVELPPPIVAQAPVYEAPAMAEGTMIVPGVALAINQRKSAPLPVATEDFVAAAPVVAVEPASGVYPDNVWTMQETLPAQPSQNEQVISWEPSAVVTSAPMREAAPAPVMAERPQFIVPPAAEPELQWNDIGNYDGTLPAQAKAEFSDLAPVTQAQPYAPVMRAPVTVSVPAPVAMNDSVSVYPLDGDAREVQTFAVPAYSEVPYEQQQPQKLTLADKVVAERYGDLLQRVFFAHGSDRIGKNDRSQLKTLSQGLGRTETDLSVTVVGHASKRVDGTNDPIKKKMINFEMAQKRANAVTIEMTNAGVSPGWVQTVSQGDSEPNRMAAGRSQEEADRRVEIYVDRE